MPNAYNSIFTGGHNDEYDIRITALEEGKINKIDADSKTGDLDIYDGNLNIIDTNMVENVAPEANYTSHGFYVRDQNENTKAWLRARSYASGDEYCLLETGRRINETTTIWNTLGLGINSSGGRVVYVNDKAAWQQGLGLNDVSSTSTISQIISVNSTNATISSAQYAQCGKIAMVRIVWTNKSAISVPASGNISNVQVGTLVSGKRPKIFCHAHSNGDNAGAAWYSVGTDGVISLGACESTGSARTIAASQTFSLCATYILA